MKHPNTILACIAVLAVACAGRPTHNSPGDVASAERGVTGAALLAHVRELASDRYEGRAPGSEGERLTVDYLSRQFAAMGLKPGNPDGRWVQDVPLVGINATRSASVTVRGKPLRFNFPDDYVANSLHVTPKVEVKDSEMVFVGYGVVAPEFGWDDYKGLDVRGKTIVMLVNDPQVPDPADASKLDASMFAGRAMTYYGRWTYKYEIASEKGAAAVLIVHETGPAGYPYAVVAGSWGHENFSIDRADGYASRVPVEGWMTEERARTLLKLSGQSFDALKAAAVRKDFRPVPLPARASFTVNNTVRRIKSQNVLARLEGSDPQLRDQVLIYTAHWDHLGRDKSLEGDQIFNGALDNASGTAALLEMARAFSTLPVAPRRSILFLAVTAEEQGLLGSKWYAENPLYPLRRTVANINMDGLNIWGPASDVVLVGKGQSSLDDVLAAEAARQGRVVVQEPTPEKGYYYRSDHFEFAKVGVPALYADGGTTIVGKPDKWGEERAAEYVARDYHKVSDEVREDWNLDGAAQDVTLLFRIGLAVDAQDALPQWNPGSEFRARRDAMMGAQ